MADFFTEVTNAALVDAYRGLPEEERARLSASVPELESRLSSGDQALAELAQTLRSAAQQLRALQPEPGPIRGVARFAPQPPTHPFSEATHEIFTLKNPVPVGKVLHRMESGPVGHWFLNFSGVMVAVTCTGEDFKFNSWDIIKPSAAAEIRRLFARESGHEVDDATMQEIMKAFVHNVILKNRQEAGDLYARAADNVHFELPAKKGDKIGDIFRRAELRIMDDRPLLEDLGYQAGRPGTLEGMTFSSSDLSTASHFSRHFPLLAFSYTGPSRFKPDIYRIKRRAEINFSGAVGQDRSGEFKQTFYDFDGIFIQVMKVEEKSSLLKGDSTRVFIAKPGRADDIRRRLIELQEMERGPDGKPDFKPEQSVELKRFFDDTFYPVNLANPQTPLEHFFAKHLKLLETQGEKREAFLEVIQGDGHLLLERLGYNPEAEAEPVIKLSNPRLLAHRVLKLSTPSEQARGAEPADHEIWILDFSGIPVVFSAPDLRPEMGLAAILKKEELEAVLAKIESAPGEPIDPDASREMTQFIFKRQHRMIRHVPRSPHHPVQLDEKDIVLDVGDDISKATLNLNEPDFDDLERFGFGPTTPLSMNLRPEQEIRLVTIVHPDRPKEVLITYAFYNFNGIHVVYSVGSERSLASLRGVPAMANYPDGSLAIILKPESLREIRNIIGDDDVTLRDRPKQARFMKVMETATKRAIPHTGANMQKFSDQRIFLEFDLPQKDFIPRVMTAQLRIDKVPLAELMNYGLGGTQTLRAPPPFSSAWFDERTGEDPSVFQYLLPDGSWEKGILLKTGWGGEDFFAMVTRNAATGHFSLLFWLVARDDTVAALKNKVLKALAGNKRIFDPAFGQAVQNSPYFQDIDGVGDNPQGDNQKMLVSKGRLVVEFDERTAGEKRQEFFPHPHPPKPLRSEDHPVFGNEWFDSLDISDPGVFFAGEKKFVFIPSPDERAFLLVTAINGGLFAGGVDGAIPNADTEAIDRFLTAYRQALAGSRIIPKVQVLSDQGFKTTLSLRFWEKSEGRGESTLTLDLNPINKNGVDLSALGRMAVSGRHLVSATPDRGVHVFSVSEKAEPFTRAWFEAIADSNPNVFFLQDRAGGWRKVVLLVNEPKDKMVLTLISTDEKGEVALFHLMDTSQMELSSSILGEIRTSVLTGRKQFDNPLLWEGLCRLSHYTIHDLIRRGDLKMDEDSTAIKVGGGPHLTDWARLYVSNVPMSVAKEEPEVFTPSWFLFRGVSDPGVFFMGEKKFILLESSRPMGGVLVVTLDDDGKHLGYAMINSLTPTLGSNILDVVRATQRPGANRFLPKPFAKWFLDADGERVIVLSTLPGGKPFPHGFWQLPKMGESIRYANGTWTLTPEGIVYASDDGRERGEYSIPSPLRGEGQGEGDLEITLPPTPSPRGRGSFLTAEWFLEYVKNRNNPGIFFNGIQPFVFLRVSEEKDLLILTVNDEGVLLHGMLLEIMNKAPNGGAKAIRLIEAAIKEGKNKIGDVPPWRFKPMEEFAGGVKAQEVALFQRNGDVFSLSMVPLEHGQVIPSLAGLTHHIHLLPDRLQMVIYENGKFAGVREATLPEEHLPASPRVVPSRGRPQKTDEPTDAIPALPAPPTLKLVSAAIDDFHRVRPNMAAIPLTEITGSTNLGRFTTVADKPLPIVMRITGANDELKVFANFRRKASGRDNLKIDIRWGSGADEVSYQVGGVRDNFTLTPEDMGSPKGEVKLVYRDQKTQLLLDPKSDLYHWLDNGLHGPRVTMELERKGQGARLVITSPSIGHPESFDALRTSSVEGRPESMVRPAHHVRVGATGRSPLLEQIWGIWSPLKPVEETQPDGSWKLIIAFSEAESDKIAALITETGKVYEASVKEKREVVWKRPVEALAAPVDTVRAGLRPAPTLNVLEPFTTDIAVGEGGHVRIRGKKTLWANKELKEVVVTAAELDTKTNKRDVSITVREEAIKFPITEFPVRVSVFREILLQDLPPLTPPYKGGEEGGWEAFDLILKIQRGKLVGEIEKYTFISLEESLLPDLIVNPSHLDDDGQVFADPFKIKLTLVNHPVAGNIVTGATLELDESLAVILSPSVSRAKNPVGSPGAPTGSFTGVQDDNRVGGRTVQAVVKKYPTRATQSFTLNFNLPGFGTLSYDVSPGRSEEAPSAMRTATNIEWVLAVAGREVVLQGLNDNNMEFSLPLVLKGHAEASRYFVREDRRQKILALLALHGSPIPYEEKSHTHLEVLVVNKQVVGIEPVSIVDAAFLPVPIVSFPEGVLIDLEQAPHLLAAHSTMASPQGDSRLKASPIELLNFDPGEDLVPTAKTITLIRQHVDTSGARPAFTFTDGSLYQYELRGARSGLTLVLPVRWRGDRPGNPWQIDRGVALRVYEPGENAMSSREVKDGRLKVYDNGGDWAVYLLGTRHAASNVGPKGEKGALDFNLSAVVSPDCPALVGLVNVLDEQGSDAKKQQFRDLGHKARDLAVVRLLTQWGDEPPKVYARPKVTGKGRDVSLRFFSTDPAVTEWAELSPVLRDLSKRFHRFGGELNLTIGYGIAGSASVPEVIRVRALQDAKEKRPGVYLLVEILDPAGGNGKAPKARIFELDANEGTLRLTREGMVDPDKPIEVVLREGRFPVLTEEDRREYERRKTSHADKAAVFVDPRIPELPYARQGYRYPERVSVLEDPEKIRNAIYPLLGRPFLPTEETLFAQVLNGRKGERMTFLSATGALLEVWMESRAERGGRYYASELANPVHRVAGRLIVPNPEREGDFYTLPVLMHPSRLGTTRLELIVGPEQIPLDFVQGETTLTISGRPAFGFYAAFPGAESREAQGGLSARLHEWVECNSLDVPERIPTIVELETGNFIKLSNGIRIQLTVQGSDGERFAIDQFVKRLDPADWPKNPVMRTLKPDGSEGSLKVHWPHKDQPLFLLETDRGNLALLYDDAFKPTILSPRMVVDFAMGEEIHLGDGRVLKLKVSRRPDGSFELKGYKIVEDEERATVGSLTLSRARGGGSLFYLDDERGETLRLVVLDNGRPLVTTRPEGVENFLKSPDSQRVRMVGTLGRGYNDPEVTSSALRYRLSPEGSPQTLFEVHAVFGRWLGATDSAFQYSGKKASVKFRVLKNEGGEVTILPEGLIKREGANEAMLQADVQLVPSFNGKVRVYIREKGEETAFAWMEFENLDALAGEDNDFKVALAHYNQRNRKLNLLPSEEGFLQVALRNASLDPDLVDRLRGGFVGDDLEALSGFTGTAGEYALIQGMLDAAGYREGNNYWAQAFRALLEIAGEVKRVKGDVGAQLIAPEAVGAGLKPAHAGIPTPVSFPPRADSEGGKPDMGVPSPPVVTSEIAEEPDTGSRLQEVARGRDDIAKVVADKRKKEAEELAAVMAELEPIVLALVHDKKPGFSVIGGSWTSLKQKVSMGPTGLLKEAKALLAQAKAVRDFVPKVEDKTVPKGKEWMDKSPDPGIRKVLTIVYELLLAKLKMKKRGTLTKEEFVDAMMKAHVVFRGTDSRARQLRAAVTGLLKWNRELVDEDLIYYAMFNFKDLGAGTVSKGKGRVEDAGDIDEDDEVTVEPPKRRKVTRAESVPATHRGKVLPGDSGNRSKGDKKGTRAVGELEIMAGGIHLVSSDDPQEPLVDGIYEFAGNAALQVRLVSSEEESEGEGSVDELARKRRERKAAARHPKIMPYGARVLQFPTGRVLVR